MKIHFFFLNYKSKPNLPRKYPMNYFDKSHREKAKCWLICPYINLKCEYKKDKSLIAHTHTHTHTHHTVTHTPHTLTYTPHTLTYTHVKYSLTFQKMQPGKYCQSMASGLALNPIQAYSLEWILFWVKTFHNHRSRLPALLGASHVNAIHRIPQL